VGNPDLQMSSAENFDVRLEWFPRAGAIASLSVFKKKIEGPIEAVGIDPNTVSYENYEKADVQGIEGEWTTTLDIVSRHLKEFTLGINGSYIESEVPLNQTDLNIRGGLWKDTATSRPMYDQPEYTFNGELTWDHKASGTLINISMGVVGRRLVLGGRWRPDEYEEPAPQLNFSMFQRLGKHWKLKFTAKNLLNPEYETTQDWPRYYEAPSSGSSGSDIPAAHVTLKSYTKGITFGLSLGYEF
jgi:outer membrane receptor protein involved in Fe transport